MEYTANYCTLSKLNPTDSICCSRSSPSAFLPTSSPSFPLSLLPVFPPLTLSFMYLVIALCMHVEIREQPSGVRPLLSLCGTWHWTQVSKLGDSPFLQWLCSFALILFLFYPHKSSLHHLLLIIYYGVCWLKSGWWLSIFLWLYVRIFSILKKTYGYLIVARNFSKFLWSLSILLFHYSAPDALYYIQTFT